MKLTLKREEGSLTCTIGRLFVDDQPFCYTLEDVVREVEGEPVESWKVKNETAIPRGTYNVSITYSPHFKCNLPTLEGVPGFTYIHIHPGNTDVDTEGCILVGEEVGPGRESILRSRDAFNRLFPLIVANETTIEIS